MTLVSLDSETTGLDPDAHEIWELALIVRGHRVSERDGTYLFQLPVDLSKADPEALKIGRFHERSMQLGAAVPWYEGAAGPSPSGESVEPRFVRPAHLAAWLPALLDRAQLVGVNPGFDAGFLRRLLRGNGQHPSWDYHLTDLWAMTRGFLLAQGVAVSELPSRSDDLSRAVAVEPPSGSDRHSALGDSVWAMRWFDRLTGGAR